MVSQLATVEKVSNGFVVEIAGTRFIAADAIDLATVFEDIFAVPEVRFEPTPEGIEALEALKSTRAVVSGDQVASNEQRATSDEWPTTVDLKAVRPEAVAVADTEFRVPVADDGFEYPPVKKLGEQNFVVQCPNHGEQAMVRVGLAFICPKKTNRAECTTRIPREALARATKAAA